MKPGPFNGSDDVDPTDPPGEYDGREDDPPASVEPYLDGQGVEELPDVDDGAEYLDGGPASASGPPDVGERAAAAPPGAEILDVDDGERQSGAPRGAAPPGDRMTDAALQLAILEALRRSPAPMSKRAVQEAVRAKWARVSTALDKLLEQGAIGRRGQGYVAAARSSSASTPASSSSSPRPRPTLRVVPLADDDRPPIELGPELHEIVNRGVEALQRDPSLYQKNGALVHVVRLKKDISDRSKTISAGTPQILDVPPAMLRERLTSCARWLRLDKRSGRQVQVIPTDDVVQAIIGRSEWPGICSLVGIIEAPGLRPDGTVIALPGYDEATGFILAPSCQYPDVPESPTLEDARAALAELEDVFADFPYEKPAGRTMAVAAVLTLIARPAIDGATPALLYDANTPGSGKTLQADAAALIATGRGAGRKGFPTDQRGANDEVDKVLCSYALMGAQLINFDNIGGAGVQFGGPALEAVLTAEDTAEFRKLGGNTMVKVPWRTLIMGSGNNIMISRDMNRRVMLSRIESPYPKPELRPRSAFKHPDRAFRLKPWIQENRPRLVVAALTLLRAHAVAGRPGPSRTWGGFEAWTKIIADAIVWAGGADPLECRPAEDSEDNPEKMSIGVVLREWHRLDVDGKGITLKTLIASLYPPERVRGEQCAPDGFDDMRTAIELLVPTRARQMPDATELGHMFRRYKGSNVGGLKIVPAGQARGIGRWTVAKVQGVMSAASRIVRPSGEADTDPAELLEREAIEGRKRGPNGCPFEDCPCRPCSKGHCEKRPMDAGGCYC